MLTAEGCQTRRRRLWQSVPDSCEWILINSPEHLAYLCAYWPSPYTFRTNEAGAMLVLTRERAALIGDNLLRPFMEQAFVDEIVAPVWYEGYKSAGPRRNHLIRSVCEFLGPNRARPAAFEKATCPMGVPEALELDPMPTVDVGPILVALRRTKDPDEIETLRAAVKAAEHVMEETAYVMGEGITELDLFAHAQMNGHEALGFPAHLYGDFAVGHRAKGPDTLPRKTHLRVGDLMILDFSVVIQGYRGDFANTLCVGKPTNAQLDVFHACLEALNHGETLLKPGTPCREVDAGIRSVLRRAGFAADRRGHVGHGIGLAHPEAPFLVAESDETLQAGDVVTLEPSLFPEVVPHDLDGGVRIEHNYLITASGFERLSNHRLGLNV